CNARSNVGHFTQCQLFLTPYSPHVTDNHQSSMDAHMNGELETFGLLQPLIQVSQCIEDTQTRSYSSVRVIFMCLGIAKVDEQTIPEQLSDIPIVALNNFRTHLLICTDHIAPVFRVELAGESSGVHQVAEHDGKLTAFGFW